MIEPMGGQMTYRFKCLLPINVLNQRIFVFLYLWLLISLILASLTLIYAFYYLLYSPNRRWFVLQLLELSDAPFDCKGISNYLDHSVIISGDIPRLYRFIEHYLGIDGVLALRLIVAKHGIRFGAQVHARVFYIATQIAAELWQRHGGAAMVTSRSHASSIDHDTKAPLLLKVTYSLIRMSLQMPERQGQLFDSGYGGQVSETGSSMVRYI